MPRSLTRYTRPVFWPPAVILRIKCWLFEGVGASLLLLAFLLAASLTSYSHYDRSFNTASKSMTENLIGPIGAHAADLLIQTLGLAAALIPLLLISWGWKLITKQGVSVIWARLMMFFAALLLISIFLSSFNQPEYWPVNSGLGGVAGMIVHTFLLSFLSQFQLGFEAIIIASISLTFGTVFFVFATGLKKSEWLTLFIPFGIISAFVGKKIINIREYGSFNNERLEPQLGRKSNNGTEKQVDGNQTLDARKAGILDGNSTRVSRKTIVQDKAKEAQKGHRATNAKQGLLALLKNTAFLLPPLDLLEAPPSQPTPLDADKSSLSQNAQILETVLEDFGIRGEIVKVRPGPVVTLYELEPSPGTKTSRVVGLADDIARSMSALSVRIAVVPGRSVIGIELPNLNRDTVYFRELLASKDFEKANGALTLVLGKDIGGKPKLVDLARMPHLLIAGTTGSGKSVAINTMICSLLYRLPPDQCKFIMIDPKMLELSVYDGIPNLLTPVVTDASKAVFALKWAVREMEDRYRLMSQMGVRNVTGYNMRLISAQKKGEKLSRRVQTGFDDSGKPVFEEQLLSMDQLPLIVVVVDEMADLMMVAGKDIEAAIQRLAQMARAAGIHLIMATQRPSVDVITGTIKANFPNRISFQVTSKIDSRTILGEQGAEQLLGQGDMLYMVGGGQITRVHGPFVKDEEVEHIVRFLKEQAEPDYIEDVTADVDGGFSTQDRDGFSCDTDNKYYDQAVALIAREGKASTSFIQRHLQIGYNRAARIMEQMEEHGVVTKADRVGRREVLVSNH